MFDCISGFGKAATQRSSSAAGCEYRVLKRYSAKHESGFQERRESAGRLERNVGWCLSVLSNIRL
jgi:hypothetical protein